MTRDDKGPMQPPRKTRDVLKAAPVEPPPKPDAPDEPATDAATQSVERDQEDG